MVETASESLPPFDGNYERPKAKSTDRHKRETAFRVADQLQLSVTTMRRCWFIQKYGSPKIWQAVGDKKLSISRAYNIVKAEEDEKGRRFLHDLLELPEEERKKRLKELEHG